MESLVDVECFVHLRAATAPRPVSCEAHYVPIVRCSILYMLVGRRSSLEAVYRGSFRREEGGHRLF